MPKRILSGTICKATNKKTVVVEVERTFKHPIYKKTIKFIKVAGRTTAMIPDMQKIGKKRS